MVEIQPEAAEIRYRLDLFPQHHVRKTFGLERECMVRETAWNRPDSIEKLAAEIYHKIFNTAIGPLRSGHDKSLEIAHCIQSGWISVQRYELDLVSAEWACALLQDRCSPRFHGSEGPAHRRLKWNAVALLLLSGFQDIEMEWQSPYGKRVDVACPSQGIVIECGSTEAWGMPAALRYGSDSFSVMTMPRGEAEPCSLYAFRRDRRSWGKAEKYFAKLDAEQNQCVREKMEQFLSALDNPTDKVIS